MWGMDLEVLGTGTKRYPQSVDDQHRPPEATGLLPDLARGRDAYQRRDWLDAFKAMSAADKQHPLKIEDLERLAWAAALVGRDDDFLSAMERSYHLNVRSGDARRAARAAFWVGFRLAALGESARAGGWLSRSGRHIEGVEDCPEQGYLLLPLAYIRMDSGDLTAAREAAVNAAAIGERHREHDLIVLARSIEGRALLQLGNIAEGLTLLDEAMVAAGASDISPLVTGLVYCSVIAGCQQVFAVDRAREWTNLLTEWCAGQPQLLTFTGICLVHRAEIMAFGGDWRGSVEQAEQAADRLSAGTDPEATAAAFYHRAEIHRLRGELAEAERYYRKADAAGLEPQPGLALLRLAKGDLAAALASIRRVLAAVKAPLRRARFLPAAVEILLEAGQHSEASQQRKSLKTPASSSTSMSSTPRRPMPRLQLRCREAEPQNRSNFFAKR